MVVYISNCAVLKQIQTSDFLKPHYLKSLRGYTVWSGDPTDAASSSV